MSISDKSTLNISSAVTPNPINHNIFLRRLGPKIWYAVPEKYNEEAA